jgi:hypothetical protein
MEREHQAHMREMDLTERTVLLDEDHYARKGDTVREPLGGDPRKRIATASKAGTVFEPLEDAVADLQLRLATLDVGIEEDSATLTRYLPVSVYVDSDDPDEFYALHDAMVRLLETFDFNVVSETQLRRGSIFQKLTAKLRDPATKAELKRQAQLAQLALQQETLGRAQAEINARQAQAAAEVHKILDTHDDYVIAIGSLVGVTHEDDEGRRSSMIVELTPDELIAFQRAGRAVESAAGAFQMLSAIRPKEVLRRHFAEERTDQPRHLPPGSEPPGLPPAEI